MMIITYYHTLYKKDVEALVVGNIEFKGEEVYFKSGGHGYAIRVEYIRSIRVA